MSDTTHRDFWIEVLKALEPNLKRSDFLTWFQHTTVLNKEKNVVTVGFPVVLSRDWAANKYKKELLSAAQSVDPEIKEILYEVDGKLGQGDDARSIDVNKVSEPIKKVRKMPGKEEYMINTDGVRSKTLNPKYTLESYVIGPENRLAHAACMAIAKKPGQAYNPLFVYGGVGLGKTHLLQATGNAIIKHNPRAIVAYMTSEKFMNEIVDAIRNQKAKSFKTKYRNVDCLIIDDIQFLAHKERTQEEFFHTFNELYDANKQIILSADRPPKELRDIKDRLISRFEMGMIVDVQFPDYETRLAILHAKCREYQVLLPADVLEFMAYNVHHSIRELEGVLMQAVAQYELEQSTPTIRSVAKIMKKLNRGGEFAVLDDGREHKSLAKTADDVIDIVADYFKLTKSDITGSVRKKEVLVPRQICMYLIRKELRASFEQIGEEFGRNHTTVMHAVDKIVKMMRKDQRLIRDVNALKQEMGL
ncbi:chromosomal replication initiator protein DnaA [Candidatus Peregrinibacteria bacterium]|jgi:chromosomal replication initiator protein|nr:chromosomal replication initiator protein DnaA [Candidatus Peregrinibacteria bacterium]MBT7703249.1 chromosomal replication initiator protein DnaA [Candidatus Peregrinibacteria bacterium]